MSNSEENSINKDFLEIEKDRFFLCPIHLETLQDPVQGPCGHVFCRSCITTCLKRKKVCPLCQAKLEETHLYSTLLVKQMLEEDNNFKKPNNLRKNKFDILKPFKDIIKKYQERAISNRWDLKMIIIFISLLFFYSMKMNTCGNTRNIEFLLCGAIIIIVIFNYIVKH